MTNTLGLVRGSEQPSNFANLETDRGSQITNALLKTKVYGYAGRIL